MAITGVFPGDFMWGGGADGDVFFNFDPSLNMTFTGQLRTSQHPAVSEIQTSNRIATVQYVRQAISQYGGTGGPGTGDGALLLRIEELELRVEELERVIDGGYF